ncbi:MAG: FAD-binding oxidoreductase [Acidobacteriota bacterium]|nr:FAD-binding oxidoreductase [Acidobacteriota bacterium]
MNQANKLYVNDIHSKLNRTKVCEIVKPESAEDIQNAVIKAKSTGKSISVAGGFHAMGGQQFFTDGILIDMSEMNRVLKFEPERELIRVEGGIKWNELVDYTVSSQTGAKNQVGIRQKQTGADRLSIGGALSANIHGRGLQMKPFIGDIESFRIVTADGEILNCSRRENNELFCLAVGGYGLFGVIMSATIRLAKRQKVRRSVKIESVDNLGSLFTDRINEGFLYGDFQFAIAPESEDFLRKGVFSCYLPVSDETPIESNRELSAEDWKNLLFLAHFDKQKAFELYAAHYLATDEQIYWSDTHQLSVYLDNYHEELDQKLDAKNPCSEMITEIYVPLASLPDFLERVCKDFRENEVELIYGTIRLIKRDDESFLAWAREDFACVIFNLHVEHSFDELEKAKIDFQLLIERSVELGGSFYLTYHRWATKKTNFSLLSAIC